MDANLALTHFTSSAVAVYLMNKLKSASWFPLMQEGKIWLNRGFSIAAATAISVGISYTWAPESRTLAFQIPTLAGFIAGIWHVLNQYAMQETLHQVTSVKAALPAKP